MHSPLRRALKLIKPVAICFVFSVVVSVAGARLSLASEKDAVTPGGKTEVRFNRDIRPILSDKCFACHGPDAETVEGDLRLDLPEMAVGEEGAIRAGDLAESELVSRIRSADPDEIMPPPHTHKPLAEHEINLLEQWILGGAQYELHWAYTVPQRSDASKESPADYIDAHIESRLRSEGIQAANAADPITLLRRLSIDLNGLPPTPETVDAFAAQPSPEAYEDVVDRLLASPRFGERMAAYWLDLVRYADTVGYHGDQNVSQYPYRDYVIASFNRNTPYDQFVREQLAGDLLPNATVEQRIASGYNRLNQTTEEGGSQPKEYLAIYFADRVRNASQVFMGSTLGCAQCHDHKYDPFTARDFYSFGAFFADIEEKGVYSARSRPPSIKVYTPKQREKLASLAEKLQQIESQRSESAASILAAQPAWEQKQLASAETETREEHTWIDDADDAKRLGAKDWQFVGNQTQDPHSGGESRKQSSDGLVQHTITTKQPGMPIDLSTRLYTWVYLDPENPPAAIMLQVNDGDWEQRIVLGSDEIEYGRRKEDWNGYRRGGPLPPVGVWHKLEVRASDLGLNSDSKIAGLAFTQFGGVAYWDTTGWSDDAGASAELRDLLAQPAAERSELVRSEIEDFYLARSGDLKELDQAIAKLKRQNSDLEDSVTTTVVSHSIEPREVRILPRGNWMDDSGEVVQPAVPAFLGQLDVTGRPTRLDLANWLADPENPLTSRTMVNRIWSLLLGRGICSSVDDFGGQGTFPAYPDLLDDLAVDFVQSGWNIKHIVKTIVMSDVYRRSSTAPPELMEQDPYNDLFARQGRFRVPAEVVRDTALFTSGLLVEKVGGPSARPYQPPGYYGQLNFPRREYKPDADDRQFRRGLYTHWQRTFLHPMLKAFDAPSREECTAARSRSNTPVQSLVLLNDPSFVEAARGLALRVSNEFEKIDDANDVSSQQWQLERMFRLAMSKPPSSEVLAILRDVLEANLADFKMRPESAGELLSVGISPLPNQDMGAEEIRQLAAMTMVARTVLNLHETIMRY